MDRRARESDFFTVTRPAPVLSPEEREQLEREAQAWGDRQRKAVADDVALQVWMAANPETTARIIADWLDAARLAGLLAPEVTRG